MHFLPVNIGEADCVNIVSEFFARVQLNISFALGSKLLQERFIKLILAKLVSIKALEQVKRLTQIEIV